MNWTIHRLEEFCIVVRGSSPRPKGDLRYYGGKIPRLMVADVSRDGMYVTPRIDSLTEDGAKKSRPMLKGDIIIAVSGDPGEPCILNVDACIHDGFVGLRQLNIEMIFPPYLYHHLKYVKQRNKSHAVGAIYKNLNTEQIKSLQIPLPSLPIQKKIAAILDAADAYRQKTKALIDKYDELTQSIFLEMFGDPVRNDKGWEKVPLNSLCDFNKISIKPQEISNGDIYIGLECIEKDSGVIIEKFIVQKGEVKSNKYWFNEEYILYGKLRPYLNKVANPDFQGICSTDIIPIKPKRKKSTKEFIISLMRGPWFVAFAHERSSGANLPRISPKEVQKFQTINPSFDLQNQFADKVQNIEAQKVGVIKNIQKAEDLFQSLLQKAFKGELIKNEMYNDRKTTNF